MRNLKIAGLIGLIITALSGLIIYNFFIENKFNQLLSSFIIVIGSCVVIIFYYNFVFISLKKEFRLIEQYDIINTVKQTSSYIIQQKIYNEFLKEDYWAHYLTLKDKEIAIDSLENLRKNELISTTIEVVLDEK